MKKAIVGLSLIFGLVAIAPLVELPGVAQTVAPASEIDDAIAEGTRLFQEGSAESLRKAIVQFERAQQLSRSAKVLGKQATSLLALGSIYDSLGNKQEALKYYDQALPLYRTVENRGGEATTLNNIGGIYSALGNKREALKYYNQALPLYRTVENRRGEAMILSNIGLVYSDLGEKQEALKYYNQALPLRRAVEDRGGEATTLNNIGRVYDDLGNKQEALKYYNQALPLHRAVEDRGGEATTLNNIGGVYDDLGNKQEALKYYNQALPLYRAVGDRGGEATTLSNIGLVYSALGNKQEALKYYNQALPLRRAVEDRGGEATTLNNIGGVYDDLGNKREALKYYNQALPLYRAVGDQGGEAIALNNIGGVYSDLGEKQEALKYYNQALPLRRALGDQGGEAITLNNIGGVYSDLGEKQEALKYYNQALLLSRAVGDQGGEAIALNNIGDVYSDLGEKQEALQYLNQALPLIRAVGDRGGEAMTLNNIGFVFASHTQPELAITVFKQSVSVYESLRADIRQLPKEQQKIYAESIANTYRKLADILLQQNRTIEALQVLDLLKVQEFQDFFKDTQAKTQDSLGIELLPQEQAILTAFEQRANQSLNEFSQRPDIQAQLQDLKRNAVAQNLGLKTYLDLKTRVQKLGNNVALLYPLILDDRLELVVLTPDRPPIHKPVATTRKQLETQIQDFRRQLQERLPSIKQPAQQLYQKLLQPIEDELKAAGVTTIVYSPDGMMRYVPLAALYDGKQWLIERYQINYLTALSLTPLDSPTNRQPSILAAAVTQSHTVNVLGNPHKFPELRFTKPEVEQLAKNLPTTSLIDRDFTRTNLTTGISTHNILHLATHGLFVPNSPDQSIILLGDGSTLSLREIEQQWKLPNVSLVVLSACETALGGNLGNGLEILGFGYQMQRIGSRATIASLWSVDDGGTQALMNSFYQNLQGNTTKAQALQQAQIALITKPKEQRAALEKRGIGVFPAPNKPQGVRSLDHPYYWAPFILIGNGL